MRATEGGIRTGFREPCGRALDTQVARRVSVGIVDAFEAIEVDKQQRADRSAPAYLREPLIKGTAIGQTGRASRSARLLSSASLAISSVMSRFTPKMRTGRPASVSTDAVILIQRRSPRAVTISVSRRKSAPVASARPRIAVSRRYEAGS